MHVAAFQTLRSETAMQASAQPLVVQATVATPTVQMEPAGRLFFKPTCIGAASQRTLTLHNTSRVPLVFQVCPPACTPVVHCTPHACR